MTHKSLAFVRFMNLRAALETKDDQGPSLHHDADQLLAYVYEQDTGGHVISMTHLFHKQCFGAPPTIQRRVKELMAAGLLQSFEGADKRLRCLKVTEAGERYLEKCSELLCLAVTK